jgi:uncharacterized protein (TIRG00374 family)
MTNKRKWFVRAIVMLTLAGLLIWALRNAPLSGIWNILTRLQPWQIVILVLVNTLLYILVSLRWWIIVQAQTRQVPFWPLVLVRVAVFGVSYFTFGPQVGGEPLQVLALQRRYGLTYSRAAASVLMDKLLEFLVNFLLLALGLAAILQSGLLVENSMRVTGSLALLACLIAWPPIHISLMARRIYPLTALLRSMPFIPRRSRPVRFLCASEWLAATFCQQHSRALFGSVLVSLLAGLGMLLDYALMLSFMGIDLPFWKTVAGWTAGWLSFLAPLPGGLGALEASQVFALGAFGISAATAISVTLLMRARDLLIGGLGLLLAGNGFSRVK